KEGYAEARRRSSKQGERREHAVQIRSFPLARVLLKCVRQSVVRHFRLGVSQENAGYAREISQHSRSTSAIPGNDPGKRSNDAAPVAASSGCCSGGFLFDGAPSPRCGG